jgi:hypothetical protein
MAHGSLSFRASILAVAPGEQATMAGAGFQHSSVGLSNRGSRVARLFFLSQRAGVNDIEFPLGFKTHVGWDGPNGTPGKKPPAPSLEERSGTKPLEQSAQRRATNETETGRRRRPVSVRRGPA